MRQVRFILLSTVIAALCFTACKKLTTPPAAAERLKWIESLHDSIKIYQKDLEEIETKLTDARNQVGIMVEHFDYVNDPRQVEGYYIFTGWKNRYPLQKTGLVARVTEDERFELIATLTGAYFNEIGVSAAGETVATDVVPHDQALNYRAENLNTVCFTGAKADSVGQFISTHSMDEINVIYLNGNKTGTLTLPSDEKQMVARTWELYAAQRKIHNYEKELRLFSGRIAACRKIIHTVDSAGPIR